MTRENKLALIIGFGLILIVGILVSDHFSTAAQQKTADLVEPGGFTGNHAESLAPVQMDDERGTGTGLRPGPMAINDTHAVRHTSDPTVNSTGDTGPGYINIPDLQELNQQANRARQQEYAAGIKWRTIKPGETLAGIAKQEYGQESLWQALARFNSERITNPDVIPSGVTIRVPPRAILLSDSSPVPLYPPDNEPFIVDVPAPTPLSGSDTEYQLYTIKPGDSLSVISQRLLGTSRRYLELYELNRDVLSSPDRVIVGAEIRIPTS